MTAIAVPHTAQLPCVAARPFVIVTTCTFFGSRFPRHSVQEPTIGRAFSAVLR